LRKHPLRFLLRLFIIILIVVNAVTAFHAWKLTHFYGEGERTKGPEKLSTGEKISALVFGVKVPKSKTVDSLTIKHETVFFYTKKGAISIEAWYAKHPKEKGSVAMFHGHVASKSAIIPEAEQLYKMGYSVLLVDFRGHGNSDGNYTTIGYKEGEEVQLAYEFLKTKTKKKVILWGISMGAAAITSAFNSGYIKPDGVILEMPFGSMLEAVEGRVKMMELPPEPLSTMLTFWGGAENGFWAFDLKPKEYAKKIHCPVLLQAGKLDSRVSLQEIEDIYQNIPTEKQKVIYETARHESLFKKEPEKWIESFKAFEELLKN
jgi:hypothetical protein